MTKDKTFSENYIEILKEEDRKTMNQNRRYYRHNISLEQQKALIHTDSRKTIGSSSEFEEKLNFLELIENPMLHKALKKLNDIDIEILESRYRKKMLFKEIAAELDLTIDNAKKRHSRALKRLKNYLQE